MREIKFRAWDKEDNKMYYNAERTYDFGLNDSDIMEENFGGVLNNDNFIVMQYTGVKDKSGKEIYEGDIVECFKNELATVKFISGCFVLDSTSYTETFHNVCGKIKVIGNIYETPDLLK